MLGDSRRGLHPGKDIPRGSCRGIAKRAESVARWLHVVLAQLQGFLHGVQNPTASSVQQEVVEDSVEVRLVLLVARASELHEQNTGSHGRCRTQTVTKIVQRQQCQQMPFSQTLSKHSPP